jgi:hypothetical protein
MVEPDINPNGYPARIRQSPTAITRASCRATWATRFRKRGLCLIVRTKPTGKAWLAENLETGQVPLGIDSVRE